MTYTENGHFPIYEKLDEERRRQVYVTPLDRYLNAIYPGVPPKLTSDAAVTLSYLGNFFSRSFSKDYLYSPSYKIGILRGSENKRALYGEGLGEWIPDYYRSLLNSNPTTDNTALQVIKKLAEHVPDIDFRYNPTAGVDSSYIECKARQYVDQSSAITSGVTCDQIPIPGDTLNKIKFTEGNRAFSLDIGVLNPDTHYETRYGYTERPIGDSLNTSEVIINERGLYIVTNTTLLDFFWNGVRIVPNPNCRSYTQALSGLIHSQFLGDMRFPWIHNYQDMTPDQYIEFSTTGPNASPYSDSEWWKSLNNPATDPEEHAELTKRRIELINDVAFLPSTINPIKHIKMLRAYGIHKHLPIAPLYQDTAALNDLLSIMNAQINPNNLSLDERGWDNFYRNMALEQKQIGPLAFMNAYDQVNGNTSNDPFAKFAELHDPTLLWQI